MKVEKVKSFELFYLIKLHSTVISEVTVQKDVKSVEKVSRKNIEKTIKNSLSWLGNEMQLGDQLVWT